MCRNCTKRCGSVRRYSRNSCTHPTPWTNGVKARCCSACEAKKNSGRRCFSILKDYRPMESAPGIPCLMIWYGSVGAADSGDQSDATQDKALRRCHSAFRPKCIALELVYQTP